MGHIPAVHLGEFDIELGALSAGAAVFYLPTGVEASDKVKVDSIKADMDIS